MRSLVLGSALAMGCGGSPEKGPASPIPYALHNEISRRLAEVGQLAGVLACTDVQEFVQLSLRIPDQKPEIAPIRDHLVRGVQYVFTDSQGYKIFIDMGIHTSPPSLDNGLNAFVITENLYNPENQARKTIFHTEVPCALP